MKGIKILMGITAAAIGITGYIFRYEVSPVWAIVAGVFYIERAIRG